MIKACPSGWHLPTDSEWSRRVSDFGGTKQAGAALKNGNGTNSSGFSAIPAYQRKPDGRYMVQGYLGFYWSSSLAIVGTAWEWNLHYGGHTMDKPLKSKMFRFDADVAAGLSVRCVRD